MSEKCLRCFRPAETCYCAYITPVQTGIKFVFLMHPKEAYRQRTGTGRLAHLSLPESEIIVGIDFTHNMRLAELLSDPAYYPVLLYPGDDAWTAAQEEFKQTVARRQLLVIVVDATWFFAKKILRLSTNLHSLPKLSFRAGYRSQFIFKQQPAPECLSTIESCYYLIRELQSAGIAQLSDPEPLMTIFSRMVQFQLAKEKERIASGETDRYRLAGSLRERKRRRQNEAHPAVQTAATGITATCPEHRPEPGSK